MILNEQVQAKWKPILEHEELPNIDDNYKKSVTAILLENQEKMMREQAAQQQGSGLFLTEHPNGGPMGSGMDAANFGSVGGDGLNAASADYNAHFGSNQQSKNISTYIVYLLQFFCVPKTNYMTLGPKFTNEIKHCITTKRRFGNEQIWKISNAQGNAEPQI